MAPRDIFPSRVKIQTILSGNGLEGLRRKEHEAVRGGGFGNGGRSISPKPSAVTMDGPQRSLLREQKSPTHDIMESIDDIFREALAVFETASTGYIDGESED